MNVPLQRCVESRRWFSIPDLDGIHRRSSDFDGIDCLNNGTARCETVGMGLMKDVCRLRLSRFRCRTSEAHLTCAGSDDQNQRKARCIHRSTLLVKENGRRRLKAPIRRCDRVIVYAEASSIAGDSRSRTPPENIGHGSLGTIVRWLDAFYRFTRPHTMLGTAVSVVSISVLAAGPGLFAPEIVKVMFQALFSALLMNICIVGMNQIFDIEIDRVNKPYLPLAAGDFSRSTGIFLVVITGLASLMIGISSKSLPLMVTLLGSLLLGIAYSTDFPFLRWKRHPVAAAMCILTVRAVLVQLGFFYHMQFALPGRVMPTSRPIIFATGFMLLFSIVIALFKDIPDVSGDKAAGVKTLSVRLGQRRVFWICIWLLEAAYVVGAAVAIAGQGSLLVRLLAATLHVVVGALIYQQATRTNLEDPNSIYDTYMDIWKAFYLEYLLLPLLR